MPIITVSYLRFNLFIGGVGILVLQTAQLPQLGHHLVGRQIFGYHREHRVRLVHFHLLGLILFSPQLIVGFRNVRHLLHVLLVAFDMVQAQDLLEIVFQTIRDARMGDLAIFVSPHIPLVLKQQQNETFVRKIMLPATCFISINVICASKGKLHTNLSKKSVSTNIQCNIYFNCDNVTLSLVCLYESIY